MESLGHSIMRVSSVTLATVAMILPSYSLLEEGLLLREAILERETGALVSGLVRAQNAA
jgi:hypothetical protein